MTAGTTKTSWHHDGHNGIHEYYKIACFEFELLVARSEGRCERCGNPDPKLVIDHDHNHPYGRRAVRGLVCSRCNQLIAVAESGYRPVDELTAKYFRLSFHQVIPPKRPNRYFLRQCFNALIADPDGLMELLAPAFAELEAAGLIPTRKEAVR